MAGKGRKVGRITKAPVVRRTPVTDTPNIVVRRTVGGRGAKCELDSITRSLLFLFIIHILR